MADEKKGKRWKKAALITAAAAAAASMAMAVYAYWSVPGSTLNFLTMSSYENRIVEEYEIPDSVNPSQTVSKIVNVKNTGTVDTLIRVSVEKAFGTRLEDGSFQADETLDPEMIEIAVNDRYWVQRQDGYFYYKEILKAGEMTKEPLFSSYTLSEKADNRYRKKDAQIVVSMESVQAEGDALTVWGVTWKDMGITQPSQTESQDTAVHYLGKTQGFDITRTKTDLFASFKNLFPGCARTQKIYLYNDSDTQVELFLRAEAVDQDAMSAEQLTLVRQLLNEYGVIQIKEGEQVLYHGPVSGTASGQNMKHNINLGQLKGGASKTLTVTLSLDPSMDNAFLELTGKVKWVFTAVGEDSVSEWPVAILQPPKTGDETKIGMWAALLGVGAAGAAAAWKLRSAADKRGRRTKEQK